MLNSSQEITEPVFSPTRLLTRLYFTAIAHLHFCILCSSPTSFAPILKFPLLPSSTIVLCTFLGSAISILSSCFTNVSGSYLPSIKIIRLFQVLVSVSHSSQYRGYLIHRCYLTVISLACFNHFDLQILRGSFLPGTFTALSRCLFSCDRSHHLPLLYR